VPQRNPGAECLHASEPQFPVLHGEPHAPAIPAGPPVVRHEVRRIKKGAAPEDGARTFANMN